MRQFISVVTATLAAALAPALVFSSVVFALGGKDALPTILLTFVAALVVALAHTLVLGLPAAGWLLRIHRFRLRPMLLAGFLIGLVPTAIWIQPYRNLGTKTSSWSNGVQTLDNGVTTWAGWIEYVQFVTYAGTLGALGSVAFYFVYKGICPNHSFKPTPLRGAA